MKCEVCGKELTGKQKYYCGQSCRNKQWYIVHKKAQEDNINIAKEWSYFLLDYFNVSFKTILSHRQEYNRIKRVYCLGKTTKNSIANAWGINHTTVWYHQKKATPYEVELANSLWYKFKGKNVEIKDHERIEKHFNYKTGKIELTTIKKGV